MLPCQFGKECLFFLLLPNPVAFLSHLYVFRSFGEHVPVADCQFSTDCDNGFPGSGFCRYPVIESGQGRFALRDGRHHFLKSLRRMAFYPVGAGRYDDSPGYLVMGRKAEIGGEAFGGGES